MGEAGNGPKQGSGWLLRHAGTPSFVDPACAKLNMELLLSQPLRLVYLLLISLSQLSLSTVTEPLIALENRYRAMLMTDNDFIYLPGSYSSTSVLVETAKKNKAQARCCV